MSATRGQTTPSKIFRDRASAGLLLADNITVRTGGETVLVAIPYGGVPVAASISQRLQIPARVCMTTRLTLGQHPELSVGTTNCAGDVSLDARVLRFLAASDDEIAAAVQAGVTKLSAISDELSAWSIDSTSAGKCFLLVDDVVATGASALGAVQHLQQYEPRSISVAAPVVSRYASEVLAEQQITCMSLLVSSHPQFKPLHYYSTFSAVDGATSADMLASL